MLAGMSETRRRAGYGPGKQRIERVRVALAIGASCLSAIGAFALAFWLAALPSPELTLARAAVVSPSLAFLAGLLRFARQLLAA